MIPRIAQRCLVFRHRRLFTACSRKLSLDIPKVFPPLNLSRKIYTSIGIRQLAHQAQSTITSFPDINRHDLFYHLLQSPNPLSATAPAFALSFIPFPPIQPDSATVIGWLPANVFGAYEKVSNEEVPRKEDVGLHKFKENQNFMKLLHQTIQSSLYNEVDDIQKNGSIGVEDGWMHIYDQRNLPVVGIIGNPEDIIASVLIEGNMVHAETYQPVPSYRVFTIDGITRLTPRLTRKLHDQLIQVSEAEHALAIRESASALSAVDV